MEAGAAGSVGEALGNAPGAENFDPSAPLPGEEEGPVDAAARTMRPSERIAAEEAETTAAEPEGVVPILGYLLEPGLAVALLGYLGMQPHDEVRHLIDGLRHAQGIPQNALKSEPQGVDDRAEAE